MQAVSRSRRLHSRKANEFSHPDISSLSHKLLPCWSYPHRNEGEIMNGQTVARLLKLTASFGWQIQEPDKIENLAIAFLEKL